MRKNREIKKSKAKKEQFSYGKKKIYTVCAILFSSVMVLGSTFAWYTSKDEKNNHFDGSADKKEMGIEITEKFDSPSMWSPGTSTEKKVQVENNGNVPTFVRLSLYEYLMTFKVDMNDQTGNGNLMTVDSERKPIVDPSNPENWEEVAQKGGTYLYNEKYYVASNATIPADDNDCYHYKDPNRINSELKWFDLHFSKNLQESQPTVPTKNYWLYQNGYFYYSELLLPNEKTSALLESVSLDAKAPNRLKGAVYLLKPKADAHDESKDLFSSWNLDKGSPAYKLYEGKVK